MTDIVISLFAAAALLGLAGFFLYRERSRPSLYLCAALSATALLELFDLGALSLPGEALFFQQCAVVAESLLPGLWILCSLTFARQSGLGASGRGAQAFLGLAFLTVVLPVATPLEAICYAPDFPAERMIFLNPIGFYYYLWIMTCLVFALVQFEKTYVSASPGARFTIKFDTLGLGTILAVLIFYYSQALLYRTLNLDYLPVRSVMYLVATALTAYSLLHRRIKVRIGISRQAAMKSVVLLAVGAYLLLIGLLGEGMQHFGFSFPRTVTVSIAFLLGIALLTGIMSVRVRREVKVILHKNFYQNKYDYRTQWLNFTMQLATSRSSGELQQRILAAYCDVFGMTGAALFLHHDSCGGYTMTAGHQMAPIEDVIQPGNALIRFMKERAWVVCVKDHNPEIMPESEGFFQAHRISFIVPIFDGPNIEGFIALGPLVKEDEVYIYEDYDLMKTIARQASLAFQYQKMSEQVTEAREIEAIGNVATFVAHDLKNQVSNLSLILENAPRHISNPEFQQDMLVSLGNTVAKMQRLIASLKNLGDRELYSPQPVSLLALVEGTAAQFAGSMLVVTGRDLTVNVDAGEIQKVVMNLIVNAIEASLPGLPVAIDVGAANGVPYITVTDHGCGMTSSFIRTELYKPFRTSKSQGLGIGLYQSRKILEAHGGRFEVSSTPGSGTTFTMWLGDSAVTGGESSGKTGKAWPRDDYTYQGRP